MAKPVVRVEPDSGRSGVIDGLEALDDDRVSIPQDEKLTEVWRTARGADKEATARLQLGCYGTVVGLEDAHVGGFDAGLVTLERFGKAPVGVRRGERLHEGT